MTARNPNKLRAAHDALAAAVAAAFPNVDLVRNPGGHTEPKNRKPNELTAYLAQVDDPLAEVLAVMTGPVYDLKLNPGLTIIFSGGAKDERQAAAWAAVEVVKAMLAADRYLGGTVDYADLEAAESLDAGAPDPWMAGGLDLRVRLLLTAPTPAG